MPVSKNFHSCAELACAVLAALLHTFNTKFDASPSSGRALAAEVAVEGVPADGKVPVTGSPDMQPRKPR